MNAASIVIRAMEPEDFSVFTEVWNQPRVIWGTLQLPFTSVQSRRKQFESLPANHTMLAAVIDGKVIGAAGLHPHEHRRRAHAAEIGMAVHDQYAGRGAGRALLAALIEQADKWLNYTRLELSVWADNSRAIALYESAGFEREGLFRRYAWRDGEYVDAIAMARLRNRG